MKKLSIKQEAIRDYKDGVRPTKVYDFTIDWERRQIINNLTNEIIAKSRARRL